MYWFTITIRCKIQHIVKIVVRIAHLRLVTNTWQFRIVNLSGKNKRKNNSKNTLVIITKTITTTIDLSVRKDNAQHQ